MATQLKFHEKMTGFFARGVTDPRVGYETGRKSDTTFGFELTIETDDLDRFIADPEHKAKVVGHYVGNLFPGEPAVASGTFEFMSPGPGASRRMEHHHTFEWNGATYRFDGEKDIEGDPLSFGTIPDLTTLYSRISDANGNVIAAGVLHFPMIDFPKLVASFEASGDDDPATAKTKFLKLFLKEEIQVLISGYEPPPPPPNRRRVLSKPHQDLAPRYDVVIVGSGYGGGAAAARLSAWERDGKRKSVCVLERGREWRAGDFPDEPWQVGARTKSIVNPEGLFDFHLGKDIDVLVGNGLGGTSLINANAMIRPETDVLSRAPFPKGLPDLGKYLDRALATLDAKTHPSEPLKSTVFRAAAKAVGVASKVDLVPIAVHFEKDETREDSGVNQTPCINCGGCVTGCNFTSKNTVDMTYLAIAEKQGAAIFTNTEVLSVATTPNGITVTIVDHEAKATRTIEASQVILSAGTLGTFGILAKSRRVGLAVSDRLGKGFSGNGDVLGFGYNSDDVTDVESGPTINAVAEYRRDDDPSKHLVIEDGGIPRALMALVREGLSVLQDGGVRAPHGLFGRFREWLRVWADRIGLETLGAMNHTLVYLSVGFEERPGEMVLDGDRVRIDWPGVATLPFAKRAGDAMAAITRNVAGTYIEMPDAPIFPLDRMFTVHPLGGCAMGNTVDEGVVNVRGEVFGHEGRLYVADGSILPGPIGVNPALVIAALSEWICEGIMAGWDA